MCGRELLSQRESQLRVKSVHPITHHELSTAQPIELTSDVPITAALGAGRIADLKTQLVKSKVTIVGD